MNQLGFDPMAAARRKQHFNFFRRNHLDIGGSGERERARLERRRERMQARSRALAIEEHDGFGSGVVDMKNRRSLS